MIIQFTNEFNTDDVDEFREMSFDQVKEYLYNSAEALKEQGISLISVVEVARKKKSE
jgi:hypothetical protein